MSRTCDICQKGYNRANQITTGIGKRVSRRTTIRQHVNLRTKRLEINGRNLKLKLCTKCLSSLKLASKEE